MNDPNQQLCTSQLQPTYSVVQKNSSMFEFPAILLPTNLGQPMHSPSALTEHVSLNLARFFFCSTLYLIVNISILNMFQPNFLHVVPPLLGFLANSPTVTPELVSSTRDILVAAAPVSSYLTEKIMEKAPNVVVREGKIQSMASAWRGAYSKGRGF